MTVFRLHLLALFLLVSPSWLSLAYAEPTDAGSWRMLADFQQVTGITNFIWDGDSILFSNEQHTTRFYYGRRRASVDGTTVWLNALPTGSVSAGDWRLGTADVDQLQLAILTATEHDPQPLRVLLDPGHGGNDAGAESKHPPLKEKHLTLQFAKEIGQRLKQAGMHVEFTRTRDTTISLSDRVRMANKKKADLFVSIHANHAENTQASGIESYILPLSGYPGTAEGCPPRGWQIGNRNDYHNTLLGFSIQSQLAVQTNIVDRGLKRQAFFVLRETVCPAVLIEFGFLSNPDETCKLLSAECQHAYAQAVADGVLAYAKRVKALDLAAAQKRARDAERNERWRRHLAARRLSVTPPETSIEEEPPSPPPPIATSATSSEEPPPPIATSATYVVLSPKVIRGTNAAPVEINTLIDFYSTGTLQ